VGESNKFLLNLTKKKNTKAKTKTIKIFLTRNLTRYVSLVKVVNPCKLSIAISMGVLHFYATMNGKPTLVKVHAVLSLCSLQFSTGEHVVLLLLALVLEWCPWV
jgi:hypothetical protein